jgi:hypothetical protein
MKNPYEAPGSSRLAGGVEGDAAQRPSSPRISVLAYILAVISGLFVTLGVMIVVAFSHLLLGDWASTAPRPVLVVIPFGAIGLGVLSAWQSLRQAKQKAIAKHKT